MIVLFKNSDNILCYGKLLSTPNEYSLYVDVTDTRHMPTKEIDYTKGYIHTVGMDKIIWIGEGRIEDILPEYFL